MSGIFFYGPNPDGSMHPEARRYTINHILEYIPKSESNPVLTPDHFAHATDDELIGIFNACKGIDSAIAKTKLMTTAERETAINYIKKTTTKFDVGLLRVMNLANSSDWDVLRKAKACDNLENVCAETREYVAIPDEAT